MVRKKLTSLLCVTGLVGAPAAIVYAGCGGTEEALVTNAFASYSAKTLKDFTSGYVSLFALGVKTRTLVLSAITTAAKQTNSVAEKELQVGSEIDKTYAEAKKRLLLEEMSSDVVVQQLSQGYDPCGSFKRDKEIHNADKTMRERVAATVGTYQYAGFGDRSATLVNRDKTHREKYCTADEQGAGLCTMTNPAMAGADMMPNLLLTPKLNPTPEEQEAKRAYIENMLGTPDPLPPKDIPKAALDSYLHAKAEKDALTGFAAYSFTAVNQENETIIPLLRERGEQYFGTSQRGLEWQKSLARQDDIGVMRDLIQIQALILKDAQLSLRQGVRIEGNVAALSKMATKKQSDDVRRAESKIKTQSAGQYIK